MFSKISSSCLKKFPSMAESIADLFYEIGNSMLTGSQQAIAVRWLRRSYDILSLHDLAKFSQDASGLRLCILHALGMFYVHPQGLCLKTRRLARDVKILNSYNLDQLELLWIRATAQIYRKARLISYSVYEAPTPQLYQHRLTFS
jgi:hypothetical protein